MKKHFFLLPLLFKVWARRIKDRLAKIIRLLPVFLAAALLAWFPGLFSGLKNYAVLQHRAGGTNTFNLSGGSFSMCYVNGDYKTVCVGSSNCSGGNGGSNFNDGGNSAGFGLGRYGASSSAVGGGGPAGDDGVFYDFAAFKAARLCLPERRESFCPAVCAPGKPGVSSDPGILPEARYLVQGQSGSGQPDREYLSGYRLLQSQRCDLDGDGITEEYTLRDGVVTVQAGSRLLWQSPENWWVDYFFLGDADNDGLPELNLLVWKEGSFGPHRPFWVEGEDTAVKNHFFIFRLAKGQIKPAWQSSNLDCPIYWAALADLDGNGENELVVLEGSYTDPGKRRVTIWQWNGWGFSRMV